MGSRRLNISIIVVVLALLVGSLYVIFSKPVKLGLDLSGGTQLVYQAQPNAQNPEIDESDINRSIEIIRDRVDAFGVSEPEISQVGRDGIQVGLPDVQDAQRAIDQIGQTARMYFYDLEPNVVPVPDSGLSLGDVTPETLDAQAQSQYEAVKLASKQKPQPCGEGDLCASPGKSFYLFEKGSHTYVAGPEQSERDLLSLDQSKAVPKDKREILVVPEGYIVVQDQPVTDSEGNVIESAPEKYFVLRDEPSLSGDDIKNPEQNFDPNNQPNVTFDFTDRGREAFQEITRDIAQRGIEAGTGQPYSFAIVLDGAIVSRPIIDFNENPDGIDGRNGAQISGSFTVTEAQDLAEFLKIGALPVDLKLISQSTVTATLGQQALDEGLKAGIAGLILVALFLLAYYRFLGLIAVLGLVVYAIFFLALMKLIPITLTLPGMAGLVLTIGVAADANVVIFERIKEEARKGHSMISAITTGYRRGIATIIDANVITLLTAFILFGLATAGVKGFAFLLGVGTIVSLFTAVVFTRAVLGVLGRTRLLRSPKLIGAGIDDRVRWHFDFAGSSKWFFAISGAILVISAFSFATNQLNFGIDFESGAKIEVALGPDATVDSVRNSLGDAGVDDPDSLKIQQVDNPDFGTNVFQIQGKIETDDASSGSGNIADVQDQLGTDFGYEKSAQDSFQSTTVGPTFGEQIARSAAYAIIFSLLLIAAYVAFRFEAKYAVPVMIAVVHDVLITAGVYSLVGREVSSATVAAFLTILGYSLYDTVIVFDRVRENVPRLPRATFAQIANRSLSEVLTRSLITGLSTVFLISVILVFGGETLRDFAFAMMVGVLSGTYSSILIATPILIHWKEREPAYRARAAQLKETMGYVPAFPEDNEVARVDDADADADSADGGGRKSRRQRRRVAQSGPEPAAAVPELTETEAELVEPEPEQDDRAPAGAADGAAEPEPVAAEGAGLSERDRRLAARRQRQAKRKHGRPR